MLASLVLAAVLVQQPAPLTTESLDTITTRLSRVIPGMLRDERVPGLAIVLVRDGRASWSGGYGLANRITRRRVTDSTVFPAASLGKPIAAYAALRLVETGSIGLDSSVSGALGPGWSTDSMASAVTIRHLLTHTAGLSNFLGDRRRRIRSIPGQTFAYSGVGYMVLQDVLETVGVGSLDDVTRRLVFEPLGMTASWFDTDDHQHARARGHLALGRVALPFVIVFVPVVLALVACASVARRLARRSWQPGAFGALVSLGIGAVLTAWFLNSRATTSQAALTFTLFGLATLAVPGLVFAALVRLVRVQRAAVRCAAGALGTCVVTAMLLPQAVPLPDMAPSGGNAASSLRTSARDLGQFLEECVRPRLLDASVASAFGSRQVALDHTAGWGLGIGVRTDANGVALFHWGSNPASRSFLLSYPGRGVGIVVLANGDLSRDAVVRIAELAVGGETAWQAY